MENQIRVLESSLTAERAINGRFRKSLTICSDVPGRMECSERFVGLSLRRRSVALACIASAVAEPNPQSRFYLDARGAVRLSGASEVVAAPIPNGEAPLAGDIEWRIVAYVSAIDRNLSPDPHIANRSYRILYIGLTGEIQAMIDECN